MTIRYKEMLFTCLDVGADEPIAFSILSFWKCSCDTVSELEISETFLYVIARHNQHSS